MDGSVKNLLEAEREAQKIIAAAQSEREAKYKQAKTQAQTRINVVEQGLNAKFQELEDEVSDIRTSTLRRIASNHYFSPSTS